MNALTSAATLIVARRAVRRGEADAFPIRGADGALLGTVERTARSRARAVARFVSGVEQYGTHRLAVFDDAHRLLLRLTRPAALLRSTVLVGDAEGAEVGRIVQRTLVGKVRFDLLDARGQVLGGITAADWRALDLSVTDASGARAARVGRPRPGDLPDGFEEARHCVAVIEPHVEGALRTLVLAAACSADVGLRQDPRGFDVTDVADILDVVS